MTRVLHTGDTHLGYRQYHSPERRQDFLDAFDSVIEDAIEGDFDAVVHAGDLFHDRQPSLADVHGTIQILRKLRRSEVPFLAIVGNHERTRDRQWLDLFETLGLATRLGSKPTVIGNTAFYGLDFVPRSQRSDLEYDFEPTAAEYATLVAHGLFEPFPHGDWDAEMVLEESNVDFDAMLLGDNHAPDRAEIAGTWVTYCGSTERADASEREARGYNVVSFEDGVSIRRRSLETREFVTLDLSLSGSEGAEYVRERIREADVSDAVVIVTIEGEGADVTEAAIEEFALEEGALLARVTDKREIESESIDAVTFADPDDAVRQRLRDLEPSEAALEIDEVVRDQTVADSNVRELATTRVRDLLEDDEAAFKTPADLADDTAESHGERAATQKSEQVQHDGDGSGHSAGRPDSSGPRTADGETEAEEPAEKSMAAKEQEQTEKPNEGEEPEQAEKSKEAEEPEQAEKSTETAEQKQTEKPNEVDEPEGTESGAEAEARNHEEDADRDSQVTMEEYL